jgi:hypothetical protein
MGSQAQQDKLIARLRQFARNSGGKVCADCTEKVGIIASDKALAWDSTYYAWQHLSILIFQTPQPPSSVGVTSIMYLMDVFGALDPSRGLISNQQPLHLLLKLRLRIRRDLTRSAWS